MHGVYDAVKVKFNLGYTLDFHQVLLSKVLHEDCMTFLPKCEADKRTFLIGHRK